MRCTRARKWMAAAVDGELSPRRRRALEGHLAGCDACRRERDATARVLAAVRDLPGEAVLSARLEQDTLRCVRLAACEEADRGGTRLWWGTVPLPLVAAAGLVLAVMVGVLRGRGGDERAVGPQPVAERVARAPGAGAPVPEAAPMRTAVADEPESATAPPGEPPPELAARPDLFVDLPILRNMEKLENFDAIATITFDGALHVPEEERGRTDG